MQLKEYEERIRELEGQIDATSDLAKVVGQLEGQVQRQKMEMQVKFQNRLAGVADKVKKMSLEI
jgi:uncharacterized coiled-coil protein SlyX